MPLNIAIVGLGKITQDQHIPAIKANPSFALVAVASLRGLAVEGVPHAFKDHRAMLASVPDLDAVAVCTPPQPRHGIARDALRAGKHVLVDKPMALTVAEADEMMAAADRAGTVLVPFQNTRFSPPFRAAAQNVREGAIGDVTGFRVAFGHAGPQAWAPGATWFFERSTAGGGCLIDLGVHAVDLVRAVVGDDVTHVSAVLNGRAGDVETDAQLLVRLRGGAIGSVHASWSAQPGPDHQLTVVGTLGTLHLDARTPLTLVTPGERTRVELTDEPGSPLLELLAAVAGERAPAVTAADGRASLAVVEAAYRSAGTGRLEEVR
jgi:predicted dehydrogenase